MTTKVLGPHMNLSPIAARPVPVRVLLRVTTAVLAATAYLLCLPWDLRNRAETPGALQETTPVTTVGVVGLAVLLLLLAAYLGARDGLGWTIPLVAAPPSVLLYASLATHEAPDASPWPPAWGFFSLLIAAGVTGAALAGRALVGRTPTGGDTPGK